MVEKNELTTRLRSRDATVRDAARRDVARALEQAGGNVAEAADRLGLSQSTVRRWAAWEAAGGTASAQPATVSTKKAKKPTTRQEPEASRSPKPTGRHEESRPLEPGPEAAHRPAIT